MMRWSGIPLKPAWKSKQPGQFLGPILDYLFRLKWAHCVPGRWRDRV